MRTLLFVLTIVFNVGLYSQPLNGAQIDTLVEETMKAFNVPGIAVGIIKDRS